MSKGNREQTIRRIIQLEDRISNCQRCGQVTRCIRKPSLGKGELEPDLLLVLESDNQFSRDINRMIGLRNQAKNGLGFEKVYHTYLVRCQPKACTVRSNTNCYGHRKLLDKDYRCLLTDKPCDGISIHSSAENVIACLPFLLEEIAVLQPSHVLLFGERVAEFVLKSYGFFDKPSIGVSYRYQDITFLTTVTESEFNMVECKQLKQYL